MELYCGIAYPFHKNSRLLSELKFLFQEEIVLTTQNIQNLSEFYIRLTLQQSLEYFPLELKFIKFRCLNEMGTK